MTLTKNGIPLYVQIRDSLRQQIEQGLLEQGQKLPSEDELAAEFGVSRMTVRQGWSATTIIIHHIASRKKLTFDEVRCL